MKRYLLNNGGGLESLRLDEGNIPEVKAGEVLVRMRAAAFNFRESLILRGTYPLKVKPTVVPLADGAGEIVALGEGVTTLAVGQRVVLNSFIHWQDGPFLDWDHTGTQLSGSVDGTLQEYLSIRAENALPIPAHLSYEEAATLPVAALTAWNAIVGNRKTLPGETMLTTGAGGVSLFALQLGKALGLRVIVTTSSDEKGKRFRELGADHILNYRTIPDWEREVRALTDGRGVDLVIENSNPETLAQSIQATALSGQVSVIGWLPSTVEQLSVSGYFFGLVTLRPIITGSRAQFQEMNRLIERAGIHPVIDRVFDFQEAREAFEYFDRVHPLGKVVVRI